MSEATFPNRNSVTGYSKPSPFEYRGFTLRAQDVSGANAFGYKFALLATATSLPGAEADERWEDIHALERRTFARDVTLRFTEELNQLRQPGCYSSGWFRDADIESARDAFCASVDRYHEKR